MKKMMMILFIAAMTAVNVNAQEKKQDAPKKTPEERAELMTQRMTKELALSADQQVKIKELILKREKQKQEGMEKRKAEMEKIEAQFKTILTSEQYQKFEKKKEEMKAKRQEQRSQKGNRNDGPPPTPPAPEQK